MDIQLECRWDLACTALDLAAAIVFSDPAPSTFLARAFSSTLACRTGILSAGPGLTMFLAAEMVRTLAQRVLVGPSSHLEVCESRIQLVFQVDGSLLCTYAVAIVLQLADVLAVEAAEGIRTSRAGFARMAVNRGRVVSLVDYTEGTWSYRQR